MASDASAPKFLQAKFQIGSCKGPINHNPDVAFFHPDDIPAEKKVTRLQVLKSTKKDILGSGRQEWNTSVNSNVPLCKRRFRTNSEHDRPGMYQYNYRAEKLPQKALRHEANPHRFKVDCVDQKQRERDRRLRAADPVLQGKAKCMQELEVHPALRNKAGWNTSTLVEKGALRTNIKAISTAAAANTRRWKQKLPQNYMTPMQRQAEVRKTQRIEKEAARNFVPTHNQEPDDEPEALYPAEPQYTTTVSRKYRVFRHSGVWEMNEAEGKMMWSDTGSFVKDSPGDLVTIKNPDAHNFCGPR